MPGISLLPDPPSTSDPANFATKADAFIAAMAVMVAEINVLAALMGVAVSNGNFVATAAGELTLPNQPAFSCRPAAQRVDVTGDGTDYVVVWGTEIYDIGSHFSSTVYTAPVSGKHHFDFALSLTGLLVGHTSLRAYISTSNRDYSVVSLDPHNIISSGALRISGSCDADMDAGDSASVRIVVSGSTKVVDIETDSFFSGRLAS